MKEDDDPRNPAPPGFLDRARSDMVRGSIWTALATSITIPLTLIASVILARSLGPEELGRFATYVAAFALVTALTNLGWSEATVQWLASANAREDEEDRSRLISRCTGYHLFVAGPASAVTAYVLLQSSGVAVAVAAAVLVWITQLLGTTYVVLTAGARNATSAQIGLITTTATQLGLVTAAIASRDAELTWSVVLGFGVVGPVLAVGALTRQERRALLHPQLTWRLPRGFAAYALSACAAGLVATLVVGRSEVFVLRAYELVTAAGIFAVITGLASQLTSPLDSLLGPLTPIAAAIFAVDQDRARRVFRRSLRVSAALGTAAACLMVPIGVALIEPVYGADFAAGALPFLALGLVSCLQTVLLPLGAFAFATRSAGQVLRANLVALGADVVLTFSLIPVIGLMGAVVANGVTQILSLALLSGVVGRKLGVSRRDLLRDVRIFGVGALIGAAAGLACFGLPGWTWLLSPLVVLVGTAVLVLVLRRWPTLQLSHEDVALIVPRREDSLIRRVVGWAEQLGVVRPRPV